jgi:hypothetical protein
MISEESVIGNPGFESGIFSPWVNVEGVSENQIQSSLVYTGSYALQMDSIYSIWAWVDQDLASPVVLSGNTTFSAAIYPTATGNTCGAYGRAQVTIYVNNTDTGVSRRIRYIWSGYDYPGTDTDCNVTRASYLFYDWTPNQWHILSRCILTDYTAVFGATNASILEVTKIRLENHASNGEPGTFYIDDLDIGPPEETEPMQEWKHRKAHRIMGASGTGTNYQIRVIVHYGNGTDTGENVYCMSDCQDDFDDIRFIDDDGETSLDYWRQTCYPSQNATFCVEVRDSLDENVTIFMDYGNPECETTSDGDATFLFFDDFEGVSLGNHPDSNKWVIEGEEDSNNYVRVEDVDGRHALRSREGDDEIYNHARMKNNLTLDHGVAIGYEWMFTGIHTYTHFYGSERIAGIMVHSVPPDTLKWYDGVDYQQFSPSIYPDEDVWYDGEIRIYDTGLEYLDGTGKAHTGGLSAPYGHFQWMYAPHHSRFFAGSAYTDSLYIRKYVQNEPFHSGWYADAVWHHDCSNTTGLNKYPDWNMDWWWEDYYVTEEGDMLSDGTRWYFENIPSASSPVRWHGPIYAHNFSTPFTLAQFDNFSVHLEVDNSLSSYSGIIHIYLCDSDFMPVLSTFCGDSWNWKAEGNIRAEYRFSNGSYVFHGTELPVGYTSVDGVFSIWFDQTEGLKASVPGYGQAALGYPEESELQREIRYLVMRASRLAGYTWMPSYVHDITVNHGGSSDSVPQPMIEGMENLQVEAGTSGNEIVWTVENMVPQSFEVYRNDSLLESGTMTSSVLTVPIDNLNPCVYNYTAIIYGTEDEILSDSVMVTVVDTTAPVLTRPADVTVEFGAFPIGVTWIPTDLLPDTYQIYQNETLVESGGWTSGENLTYVMDENLESGVHEVRVVVYDTSGNSNTDTVYVIVNESVGGQVGEFISLSITIGSIAVIVIISGLICRNRGAEEATSYYSDYYSG